MSPDAAAPADLQMNTIGPFLDLMRSPVSGAPLRLADRKLASDRGESFPIDQSGVALFVETAISSDAKVQQAHYDRIADAYVTNLGEWRIGQAYGMRSFAHFGITAATSSDAPVVPINALAGLQTMVTRHDILGRPCNPAEAVPLEDALRAYTVNGAYASFEEGRKGMLRPGMLGDVTVFETDLFAVSPDELANVAVDYTFVEGDVAYQRAW